MYSSWSTPLTALTLEASDELSLRQARRCERADTHVHVCVARGPRAPGARRTAAPPRQSVAASLRARDAREAPRSARGGPSFVIEERGVIVCSALESSNDTKQRWQTRAHASSFTASAAAHLPATAHQPHVQLRRSDLRSSPCSRRHAHARSRMTGQRTDRTGALPPFCAANVQGLAEASCLVPPVQPRRRRVGPRACVRRSCSRVIGPLRPLLAISS